MKKRKTIMIFLLVIYSLLMIWLLFIQRIKYISFENYTDMLRCNLNIIPFRTIYEYLSSENIKSAVINLVGNIVMFIPLGFFLTEFIKKCIRIRFLIIYTLIIIFTVEIIQLVTLTGSFDIDDIFLNISGAVIGFIIHRGVFKNKH